MKNKDVSQLVPKNVVIEISAVCNAKCKYCVTGNSNRSRRQRQADLYMSLDSFRKIYFHLYENGLISKRSILALYNWGEPFLNPDAIEIFNFLSEMKQDFIISTNASIFKAANKKKTYEFCRCFRISMPGFSQESYEHIHGFALNDIKNKVLNFKCDIKEHGFKGSFEIVVHKYKFNEDEIKPLVQWGKENGIYVWSYNAYLNGFSLARKYIEGDIAKSLMQEINTELKIENVRDLIKKRPSSYMCGLIKQLTIDYDGEIALCCLADKYSSDFKKWADCPKTLNTENQIPKSERFSSESGVEGQHSQYQFATNAPKVGNDGRSKRVFGQSVGGITNIHSVDELDKMRSKMLQSNTCNICQKLGIDYWVEHCL